MEEKNTKSKIKYRKTIWIIEVFTWILVFVLISFGIVFIKQYYNDNYNSYQLFLQDVDGIIKGSPVRMMGNVVGYVREVKIVNDTIFVDFILDEKGLAIPKGSLITVESFGLGGSKSLEIYTPKDKISENTPMFEILQPRRLGYVVGLLNTMFDKIVSMIYRVSYFSDEMQTVKFEKIKIDTDKPMIEMVKDVDKDIDNIQNKLDKDNKNKKR